MKRKNLLYASLLAISTASYLTLSSGQDTSREWQTTACQNFTLTVRDKSGDAAFVAKYLVKSSDGRIFIAEKKATDDDSARVIFPDSFHEEKTSQKAWVDCSYGEKYRWEIYTNNELIESGTTTITRNKRK